MNLLLAVNGWDRDSWRERFQTLLPERKVLLAGEDIDPSAIHYAACWKHTPGSLGIFRDMKVLFSLGAGVDHLMGDPALPDAPVVRMVDPDLTGRMTEWVAWQCLDWLRQGPLYRHQQGEHLWRDDRLQPAAQDIRVGVMGLGVLGLDAIERLRALRFAVTGWSRSLKAVPGIRTYAGDAGLAAFLAETDILVVLMPLTPETAGMINTALLRQLARGGRLGGPVLLNAGRGGLQVEADILEALEDGTLKGASLDVFETEPLPAGSPLWAHPRVTITPHNAAMSHPDAIATAIVKQIRNAESGLPLMHVVDRARGY